MVVGASFQLIREACEQPLTSLVISLIYRWGSLILNSNLKLAELKLIELKLNFQSYNLYQSISEINFLKSYCRITVKINFILFSFVNGKKLILKRLILLLIFSYCWII